MMKFRHKNKKPGKGSKGCKKPAKRSGKKATHEVSSASQFVRSNDHASREAELKKKRVEEMRRSSRLPGSRRDADTGPWRATARTS